MTAAWIFFFEIIIIIKINNEHLNRMTHPCIQHCYQRGLVKETLVKIKIKMVKKEAYNIRKNVH